MHEVGLTTCSVKRVVDTMRVMNIMWLIALTVDKEPTGAARHLNIATVIYVVDLVEYCNYCNENTYCVE